PDHIRGAEDDREEPKREPERTADGSRHEHRADDDDPVDRVRAGHERRVERRRDLRDDLEAHEDREDEHVQPDDRFGAHTFSSAAFVAACTTSPWYVIRAALTLLY